MVDAKIITLSDVVINVHKGNIWNRVVNGKVTYREVSFPHFTGTGEMMTPIDCDKPGI